MGTLAGGRVRFSYAHCFLRRFQAYRLKSEELVVLQAYQGVVEVPAAL